MIAGGSIEILKNRIAEGIFGRSFPQRSRQLSVAWKCRLPGRGKIAFGGLT